MQREIKFRAWLKDEKKMIDVELVDFKKRIIFTYTDFWYGGDDCLIEGSGNTLTFEEVELLQFAGLKDKNDVEIYELDKIKGKFKGGQSFVMIVGWNEKKARFDLYSDVKGKRYGFSNGTIDMETIEVVGNVLEVS